MLTCLKRQESVTGMVAFLSLQPAAALGKPASLQAICMAYSYVGALLISSFLCVSMQPIVESAQ